MQPGVFLRATHCWMTAGAEGSYVCADGAMLPHRNHIAGARPTGALVALAAQQLLRRRRRAAILRRARAAEALAAVHVPVGRLPFEFLRQTVRGVLRGQVPATGHLDCVLEGLVDRDVAHRADRLENYFPVVVHEQDVPLRRVELNPKCGAQLPVSRRGTRVWSAGKGAGGPSASTRPSRGASWHRCWGAPHPSWVPPPPSSGAHMRLTSKLM